MCIVDVKDVLMELVDVLSSVYEAIKEDHGRPTGATPRNQGCLTRLMDFNFTMKAGQERHNFGKPNIF